MFSFIDMFTKQKKNRDIVEKKTVDILSTISDRVKLTYTHPDAGEFEVELIDLYSQVIVVYGNYDNIKKYSGSRKYYKDRYIYKEYPAFELVPSRLKFHIIETKQELADTISVSLESPKDESED